MLRRPSRFPSRKLVVATIVGIASVGALTVATAVPGDPNHVGPVGESVTVEGVRGRWRVDAPQLEAVDESFEGRAASARGPAQGSCTANFSPPSV